MSTAGAVAAGVAVLALALAASAPARVRVALAHPDRGPLASVAPHWSLRRWEAARATTMVLCSVAALAMAAWPLAIVGPLLPSVVLRWRHAQLRARMGVRTLDVLHATAAALRSGVPLAHALRLAVARGDPLVRDPFERVLAAFDLHEPLDGALAKAARAAADRRLAFALDALALVAAERLPATRAAAFVAGAADRLSFEERLADEVRARTGGVRAQIVMLALVVPALAAYLVLTVPGLAATLATPLGSYVLIPAAGLLELAGIVASRRIVSGLA